MSSYRKEVLLEEIKVLESMKSCYISVEGYPTCDECGYILDDAEDFRSINCKKVKYIPNPDTPSFDCICEECFEWKLGKLEEELEDLENYLTDDDE